MTTIVLSELCFIRSPMFGQNHIVDSIKFSTLIKKLPATIPKTVVDRCIKVYDCACHHGFLYPEVTIGSKFLTYHWTNNTKFLRLRITSQELEYVYGDHSFTSRQIGLLDESDYDHRLLEISLFYMDEEIAPYIVKG